MDETAHRSDEQGLAAESDATTATESGGSLDAATATASAEGLDATATASGVSAGTTAMASSGSAGTTATASDDSAVTTATASDVSAGTTMSGAGAAADLPAPQPEDAVAAPPALQLPPVHHPSQGPAPAYTPPVGYGATPGSAPAGDPVRAAMLPFLAGVAVAVGVSIAGYVVLHSRGGGLLWWGGYFVTFGLWRAAWARYSATAGGRPMPGAARALMIGGVVVSVAAAAVFAYSYISDKTAPPVATGVGSCWAEEGDNVVAVPCGDADARYTATAEVSSDSECPGTSAGSIDSDQPGKVLCLAQR